MTNLLKRISQALVAAAYPDRCEGCERLRSGGARRVRLSPKAPVVIASPQGSHGGQAFTFEKLMQPYVCRTCRATYTPVTPPLCSQCGTVFASRVGTSHLCGACSQRPRPYTMARAVGVYERVLMDVVQQFKYRGKIQLARPLGRRLFAQFMRHWGPCTVDLIVPVPLHLERLRQRGFNQAYQLVREWRQLAGAAKSTAVAFQIDPHILVRQRRTVPQAGLGPKQRRANLKNALTVVRPGRVLGRHVLVVDDVYTTGATADECARTLLRSGAARVDVLTLARVM